MSRRVIDLALEITSNMLTQDAFSGNIYVQLVSHEESRRTESGIPEGPSTSTWNYIGMVEHIGTHVDTLFHTNPKGLGVDRMPLDMFFGKAICFDMIHIPECGEITVEDMERVQEVTGVKVDGHVTLSATGIYDKCSPGKKIPSVSPEITPEAVKWLADHNFRPHGVERPSTDIVNLNLSPSYRARGNLGITYYEWLINLTEPMGKGESMLYSAPLKSKDGLGSPVRAYAVIEEQKEGSGMKFFPTGGIGSVGINPAYHLVGLGDDVVIHANQLLSQQTEKMFGNCPGKVSWVCGDVLGKAYMKSELLTSNTDVFIHAAAITSGGERKTKQFEQIFRVNTLGTANALEATRNCGTTRFIYVSSVVVCGTSSQEYDPVRETVPLKPSSVYEISKFVFKHIALRYKGLYNMDIRTIWSGDVFGAWESGTGVRDAMSAPCRTLKAVLEWRHVILPKEGMTSWVYVKDAAASITALARAAPGQLNHVVYNSSPAYRWSIAQWRDMLVKRYYGFMYEIGTPSEANIKFHVLMDNDMFDVSRLREDTGFISQYGCREAFKDYTSWVNSYPDPVRQ